MINVPESIQAGLADYEEIEVSMTCPTHGEINHLAFVKKGTEPECPECLEEKRIEYDRQDRIKQMIESSGIPERHLSSTVNNYDAETDNEKTSKANIKKWVYGYKENPNISGFLMIGGVGTGKTHLISAIGKAVIGMSASFRYLTIESLSSMIWESRERSTPLTETELVESLSRKGVLALDEVGASNQSDSINSAITEIIDKRYNNRLPTILCSNNHVDGVRESIGDRAFSRTCQGVCTFDGRDRRLPENPFA